MWPLKWTDVEWIPLTQDTEQIHCVNRSPLLLWTQWILQFHKFNIVLWQPGQLLAFQEAPYAMELPHDKKWTLFSNFMNIRGHSTKTHLTYFFDEMNIYEEQSQKMSHQSCVQHYITKEHSPSMHDFKRSSCRLQL